MVFPVSYIVINMVHCMFLLAHKIVTAGNITYCGNIHHNLKTSIKKDMLKVHYGEQIHQTGTLLDSIL